MFIQAELVPNFSQQESDTLLRAIFTDFETGNEHRLLSEPYFRGTVLSDYAAAGGTVRYVRRHRLRPIR